jgi:hypothetical protein
MVSGLPATTISDAKRIHLEQVFAGGRSSHLVFEVRRDDAVRLIGAGYQRASR